MTSDVIEAGDGLALTVPALLAARVGQRGDAVLLACDDEVLTYGEAERRSASLARALLGARVGGGTRVGILHPNGAAFVVAWLAAARIGAVSVPLSTFSTSSELVGLLRGADVAVLLGAPGYRSQDYPASLRVGIPELDLAAPPPLVSPVVPSLRRIVFDGGGDPAVHPAWTAAGLLARASAIGVDVLAAAEAAVTAADRMVIVHTSGSTSEPKGVIHTHGALIRHLDNLNQLRRYTPDEVLFSNSPFFWIGGFAYALLGTLVAGAKLVCSNAPDAAGVLDVLERERPTMVNGFAASVAHLPQDPTFADRDLSSIRRGNLYPIMPAAVRPHDPELRHAMLGMTEAGSVCLASEDEGDQPEHRRGSFGRPVPGLAAQVRRSGGDGDDGVGELWFRGPFLMEGYDGRERHETFDPEGWYGTGDLVTRDAEGFVYFKGRSSDMIKTAGANVSPREVEAAILEVSGLTAHVVGIDDATRGQVVAALVRAPADGVAAVDLDDLRTRLRTRLSAYKIPRRMLALPAAQVPMMSSGKLDLRALKHLLATPAPSTPTPPSPARPTPASSPSTRSTPAPPIPARPTAAGSGAVSRGSAGPVDATGPGGGSSSVVSGPGRSTVAGSGAVSRGSAGPADATGPASGSIPVRPTAGAAHAAGSGSVAPGPVRPAGGTASAGGSGAVGHACSASAVAQTIPTLLGHGRAAHPDRQAVVSVEAPAALVAGSGDASGAGGVDAGAALGVGRVDGGAGSGGGVTPDAAAAAGLGGQDHGAGGGVVVVTYGELDSESAALGGRLVAAGVVKGDRVVLLAPNGVGWAVTALAVMRVGAVLVPLSTLLRPPELLAQLATANVTHLVAAPAFRGRRFLDDLDEAAPGLAATVDGGGRHPTLPSLRAVWRTDAIPDTAAPAELVEAMEARVRPADDMVVLFTSGSRGAPKGTIHTHGAALGATAAGLDARCVRPGERLYIPMPFFWTGGFSGGLLTALLAGATLLTEAVPEPSRTLRLLDEQRATLFRGWPDQAARLAAHPGFAAADLSALGDGSLPPVLPPERRPAPGARANLFGMTESFGPYCGDRLDTDMPPDKHGSCGRPFAGVEVRIAAPEGEADGEGEIQLRGPNLLRGICGRRRDEVFTPDGFLRTGDLGRLDADGYLWYLGRLDDMVKVKGATVYPSEVEAALRQVDGVRQAHVTDVTDVTDAAGQPEVGALVVTEAPVDEVAEDVAATVRSRLSAFKVPTRWLFTEDGGDVPTTATGKVDKARLQRLLSERGGPMTEKEGDTG